MSTPIDMVLHCPKCGLQHIDMPERSLGPGNSERIDWDNPPHRSHLCRPEDGGCGHVWRPADVETNGVQAVKTKGKADHPVVSELHPDEFSVRMGSNRVLSYTQWFRRSGTVQLTIKRKVPR